MKTNNSTKLIFAGFMALALIISAMVLGDRAGNSFFAALGKSGQRPKSLPAKFTNQYRMEFVLIPEGKFTMGSTAGGDSEAPAHSVTIAQPFYIGRYEVTQWQWRAVMTTTVEEQQRKIKSEPGTRPLIAVGHDHAIYYVSWDEAQAFVRKLNTLNDGRVYRLPSEAEWEYACRAGALEDRPADLNPIAWYKTNSNNFVQTVGMRRPNAFQLYDMIGNVWEWCEDALHLNYEGAPADGRAWTTNDLLSQKVKRGGSFQTRNFDFLRCSGRGASSADNRDVETGFRVVATVK